jgi:hypothetical protein
MNALACGGVPSLLQREREPARPERWVLHHGEALSVLRSMPDASVDAIVTDPPYSSGGFTRGDRTGSTGKKYTLTGTLVERPEFAGDNRDQRSFGYWCTLWLSECLRVAKPGAPICVFSHDDGRPPGRGLRVARARRLGQDRLLPAGHGTVRGPVRVRRLGDRRAEPRP